ncbi:MAG: DUF4407 domain-containing protein [Pseudonocardiaceae bacterium]
MTLQTEPVASESDNHHTISKFNRWLRKLTGVDETLLDRVPNERPRYTALGGIVLGTAVIAGFSMWTALTLVQDTASVLLLFPALIWALFVLNLDRWLVSSSSGSRWHRRAAILAPRLVIAFFFGVIIAEPLVLRIFDTAVEQHIQDGRDKEVDTLRSNLLRCNPVPGVEPTPAIDGCDGYLILFASSSTSQGVELTELRREAAALQESINADTAELGRLQELAFRECNGTQGAGLSGERGRGLECLRREQAADYFALTHPITERSNLRTRLNARITQLQGDVTTANADFQAVRAAEADRRVDELRANQREIGLLERFRALDELVHTNAFLFAALWFIRIFFILVDCLPVLVKFFGGLTVYDRLVDRRSATAERMYEGKINADEAKYLGGLAVEQYEFAGEADRLRSEMDLRSQKHRVDIETRKEQVIDHRYDELRGHSVPTSGNSQHISLAEERE